MKLLLKRILYLGLTISLVFLTVGVIVNTFFGETIEHTVVENIKKSINSELSIANVDFTLFEHFPNASVKLSQLYIRETEGFQNDTLLFAQEGFVQFGIFDILS